MAANVLKNPRHGNDSYTNIVFSKFGRHSFKEYATNSQKKARITDYFKMKK